MKYAPAYILLFGIAGMAALWGGGGAFDASEYDFSTDHDCSDFTSWREAQSFYQSAGAGDPHRLDSDGDGIACESLR